MDKTRCDLWVFDEPEGERLAIWRVYVFLVAIGVILRTPGWDGRSEMVTYRWQLPPETRWAEAVPHQVNCKRTPRLLDRGIADGEILLRSRLYNCRVARASGAAAGIYLGQGSFLPCKRAWDHLFVSPGSHGDPFQ